MYLTHQWQGHMQLRRSYDFLRRHLINIIVTFICLSLFIGINSEPSRGLLEAYVLGNSEPSQDLLNALFRWGVPSTIDIRNGHLWGLVTCNFFENELLWLFFSLLWLWTLGRFIEQRVGRLFYLWLIISTCIFASIMQIAFFERSHYGFGAITYSMFGFIWVNSILDPSKWSSKPDIGILFLLWAAICFILSYTKIYEVAYFTLFFGFIWGSLLAYLGTLRIRFLYLNRIGRIAIPLLLLGLCSISIFWAPWSIDWLSYKASKYYTLKDYDHAESMYLRILEKDPNSKFAQQGLQSIRINKMSEEAFNCHTNKNYECAKSLYLRILELEPENQFAKENLQSIRIGEMAEEADKLFSAGKFNEAGKICSEILRIDPKDEWAKECIDDLPDEQRTVVVSHRQ